MMMGVCVREEGTHSNLTGPLLGATPFPVGAVNAQAGALRWLL